MGAVFDAGISNLWNPLWNTTVYSQTVNNNYYYPIPEIEVPFLLDKFVLAVYSSGETARPTWRSAGFLNQKLRTGIVVGGSPDARFHNQRFWLNEITVFVLPKISHEYSISFAIHPWHEDITLQLWEFTGEVTDSTEDLIREVQSEVLTDIKVKVDEIVQRFRNTP